jgi:long-chain acyl-CoA synthetase
MAMENSSPTGTIGDNQTLLEKRPWVKFYDEGVPQDISPSNKTVSDLLAESAKNYPDVVAIDFYDHKITYQELDEEVNRFAAGLQFFKVEKGDRVALIMPNCAQFVIAYYATVRVGAIVVACNPLYVERELEHQLNSSGAVVAVTLTKFFPLVKTVQPKTAVRRIIVGNVKDYFPLKLRMLFTLFKEKKEGHRVDISGEGISQWERFIDKNKGATAPQVSIEPDDIAAFQYTGGTTGTPKGAMLTHRNLTTNVQQAISWVGKREMGRDKVIAAIPFFHVYGVTVGLNFAIATASTLIILPKFDPLEVLKIITEKKPTLFPGVPAMYIALLGHAKLAEFDLSSIEACLSGASSLPVEVQDKFEKLTGAKLVEGYGMTESSPIAMVNPMYGTRKAGSVGVPVPGIDARIVDVDTGTNILGIGEQGEIIYTGPTVMKGYYAKDEETAQTVRNGWLHTGDIGYMDSDGFFFIMDRKKDMILSNGFNVYPREVEEILFTHPKVKDVVVIGAPNKRGDTTVKAFIVLKDGETATEDEIREFSKENMVAYKAPRNIEFREALPKTLIGKTLRRVLVDEEEKKLKEGK